MEPGGRVHWLRLCVLVLVPLASCEGRGTVERLLPTEPAKAVLFERGNDRLDLLIVVDTSPGSKALRQAFVEELPTFVKTLQGSEGVYGMRIGVITADLGVAAPAGVNVPGCSPGGDGAGFLRQPQSTGCLLPRDRWIAIDDGEHNIAGCSASELDCAAEALRCLLPKEDSTCRYGAPMEAARRALDPSLALNPGFLRPEALLMVLFVAAHDDCSVRDSAFFADKHLSPFRCFQAGVRCNSGSTSRVGTLSDCKAAPEGLLFGIDRYVEAFESFKGRRGLVLLALIGGPAKPIGVSEHGGELRVQASCWGADDSSASPSVRLSELVKRHYGEVSSACQPGQYKDVMMRALDLQTLAYSPPGFYRPLATGDLLGVACHPKMPSCDGASCLGDVDCFATSVRFEGTTAETHSFLKRCPGDLFDNEASEKCGGHCPCWRLVPEERGGQRGSLLRFDVLRAGRAPVGTTSYLTCVALPYEWDSDEMTRVPRCGGNP